MLSIISPAKKLDFSAIQIENDLTAPLFNTEAFSLASIAAELSKTELGQLMSLSDNLTQLNYERFQKFKQTPREIDIKPAALAFNGDTYVGLKAQTFSAQDFEFAQDNVRILSGLYGLLRPLDTIQPYRLEMGSVLKNSSGNNLYDFWSKRVSQRLAIELKEKKSNSIINLASNEYSKVLNKNILNTTIITPQFLEKRKSEYKNISFFSKKARGAMARFIIINRIETPPDIRAFDLENYKYKPKLSSEQQPVFTRES
ncbi:MAG: peroxide stress protein YaaA [Paracoccaceae bacterium]|nr:peroxide stress protein YaaA [Paracoccaceae bacterium]